MTSLHVILALVDNTTPAAAKPGHPSLYTPDRVLKILNQVRAGASPTAAAATAGIASMTVCRWRRTKPGFETAIKQAIIDRHIERAAILLGERVKRNKPGGSGK